jgi:hypothetical protein
LAPACAVANVSCNETLGERRPRIIGKFYLNLNMV